MKRLVAAAVALAVLTFAGCDRDCPGPPWKKAGCPRTEVVR